MLLRVDDLPADPLQSAARFYDEILARVEAAIRDSAGRGDDVVLVFPPASHSHRGWRLAAVQELARKHAPRRINAVASDDAVAIVAAERYLGSASGVTGQLLPLDGQGAG